MTPYKKLGVIGGIGPAATALFFQRVVEYTNVGCDQEHLDIDILNRPSIPDRTDYLLGKAGAPSFVPAMHNVALQLESMGCEILAIRHMPSSMPLLRGLPVRISLICWNKQHNS